MKEVWKDIAGYEGKYQVSNFGNVMSLNYRKKLLSRKLKACISKSGYPFVCFSKNNTLKGYRISRLVAGAFIPNPENKPQVNHKNGIKTDNRVENLEWCTISENQIHSFRVLGTKSNFLGRNAVCKKIIQSSLSGEHIKDWSGCPEIEKKLGYLRPAIYSCCKGYRGKKQAYGYRREYDYSE